MRKLIRFFLQGVIFAVPILFTAWIIYWLSGILSRFSINITEYVWLNTLIIGVAAVIIITILGFLLTTLILRSVANQLEKLITKTPFIKIVYSALKDLVEAFVGEKKRFSQPVAFRMVAGTEVYRMGFMTQEDLKDLGLPGMATVYSPMAYSMTGNLFVVPRDQIIPLEGIESAEAMKFLISGGVTDLAELKKNASPPSRKQPAKPTAS